MPSFTHPVGENAPKPPLGAPMNPLPEELAPAPSRFEVGKVDAVRPSPFNPRGEASFDKEELAELAETVKVHGVLEPVLVRPIGDVFELMGGERRWRAAKLAGLAEIPMIVRHATDDEAMVLQIIENHQRKDLSPLEEAQSFVTLQKRDPKRWTAAEIGRKIGRTDRFVAQRMALVTRLDPTARKMMEKGDISVEKARILAVAPAHVQKKMLPNWEWNFGRVSPEQLREHILQQLVPKSAAAFDIASYKGGWHEEGKKRYFTDIEQFSKLQEGAAQALVAKLAATWPSARIVADKDLYGWAWADTGQSVEYPQRSGSKATGKLRLAEEKCTAIVWIDRTAKLRHAEGVATRKALEKTTGGSGSSAPPREKPEQRRTRLAFNADLVKAIAADAKLARRVMLSGLLFGNARISYDTPALKAMAKAVLPEALCTLFEGYNRDEARHWAEIRKLADAEVERILSSFAGLIYQWSWNSYGNQSKKPDGMPALLATELKIELRAPEPGTAPAEKRAAKAKTKKAAAKKKHR